MSIADTGRFWEILVIPILQIRKILENTGYTSRYWKILVISVDTGRFWKILVIPVLQILEDSVRSCGMYLYIVFFCPVCASVMRGRTVHRETERKETRGGGKEKRGEKKMAHEISFVHFNL
jgi:hypothetical protein